MKEIRGVTLLQAKRKIEKAIAHFVSILHDIDDPSGLERLEDLKWVMKLVEQAAFQQRDFDYGAGKLTNPRQGTYPTPPKKHRYDDNAE